MNKSLNEKVKEYADLKAQADSIAEQLTALKEEIVEAMGDEDEFTADDGTVAKINAKETFKYVDEASMVKWLKNNGYSQFVVEKVNTTPMNKELKKGLTLTESLKPMYTKTVSSVLVVERK